MSECERKKKLIELSQRKREKKNKEIQFKVENGR